MSTHAPETRRVTVTVESLGQSSRDGSRLLVKAYCPDLGATKYPIPLWVPHLARPEAGKDVVILISRGGLKRDKDGTYDTDYFWEVEEWPVGVMQESTAPQQAPMQAPEGPPEPRSATVGGEGATWDVIKVRGGIGPQPPSDIDRREAEKRESIHAQQAMFVAKDLVIAFPDREALAQAIKDTQDTMEKFRLALAAPRNPEPLEESQGDDNPDAGPEDERGEVDRWA